jgi:phosphopantetheinyl transferase (holo-ACP synthase)
VIGNDIVDLSAAKSATRALDDRYLDKICTVEEQRTIRESASPFQALWRIWSMKESVYKVYARSYRRPFYAPGKFECQFTDEEKGSVRYLDFYCHTFTTQTSAYTHTIAKVDSDDDCFCDIVKFRDATYDNQHRSAYSQLQKLYADISGVKAEDVVIKKDKNGIPEIYIKEEKTNAAFSISHHGQFAAVAILSS